MSQENVDLVAALQPAPEVDLMDLFHRGDEAGAREQVELLSPLFTQDFVCVFHALSEDERPGVAGLRQSWLDWLDPWESYRVEIDELVDCGDRVLVHSRDLGRRPGMESEVLLFGSAVWTVKDGQVARAEFFTNRAQADAAARGER
jgi:ketosteroid isomerase-like protein